jgi:ribonuclease HII
LGGRARNDGRANRRAGDKPAFFIAPDFRIERELVRGGARLIAGVDEAGRGALAGPLCVGLVIYESSFIASHEGCLPGINDSKKLTHRKRLAGLDIIEQRALLAMSVLVPHPVIDRLNINGATRFALTRLLAGIPIKPEIIIMDGNFSFDLPVPIRSIPKGDAQSISIASASIVAKVRRDAVMDRFDGLYPAYHFIKNKGYGTARHLQAITEHGATPIHRRSYEPVKSMVPGPGDAE